MKSAKHKGPGRPPKPPGKTQVKCTVRLYPNEIEKLTHQHGSLHAAIRSLVEREMAK